MELCPKMTRANLGVILALRLLTKVVRPNGESGREELKISGRKRVFSAFLLSGFVFLFWFVCCFFAGIID